jgi:hypothetical protein
VCELEQVLATEHLAWMLDEHPEQFELAGGHPHQPAGDQHLVCGEIDLETAEAKPPQAAACARAAQDRLDAGDDLRWGHRLDDVVVGAESEAAQLVGVAAAGAQEQDRDVGARADVPAEVKARRSREHHVEQHAIRSRAKCHDRVLGIGREQDAEAVRLQEVPQQRGDLGLVLHDEHERPGGVGDGVHQHSVAHRRHRNAGLSQLFRKLFALGRTL